MGCKVKNNCDEPVTYLNSSLLLDFKEASSNRYLIQENNSKYATQDISVIDDMGKPANISFTRNYSASQIEYFRLHINAFPEIKTATQFCKRFYINFKTDTDTLDYCYMVNVLKCGERLEKLEVKYNNVLLQPTESNINFEIQKK